MANGARKEFLNAGILGGGAGVPEKRGFRAVITDYIGSPEYDARYFETFPTAWASAYAFQKSLETEEKPGVADDKVAAVATEEWASLFLLHYFGPAHLKEYSQEILRNEYDKDLWLALSGTYPNARESSPATIKMLETDEGTVVGAYYPETIFFPSRGRGSWVADKMLQKYLVGTRLSWELCSKSLLTNEQETNDFQAHLRRVANTLPSKKFKDRLNAFCDKNFTELVQSTDRLDADPLRWEVPGNKAPEPEEFLEKYPLRRMNKDGGYNYYLVYGMPQPSPWMMTPVQSGWPPPYQYRKTGGSEITVQFAGKNIACQLKEDDKIISLKDLFLTDAPYWCKVSRASDSYTSRIKSLHKIELRDPVLTPNDVAVCLAPVKREFVEHFPEVFKNLRNVFGVPNLQRPSVEWTFPVLGREVKWITNPMGSTELPNTSLAIWPPRASWRWKLYVIHGFGSKESSGRWYLIDEEGSKGMNVELEEGEEYVSILQSTGPAPNRPKALLLYDNSERERGILFLTDADEQNVDRENPATLAVDFGTSNTCLAYKRADSIILKFKLSPEMIWGKPRGLENPGFVPSSWGGVKGFYPTLLLSRRSNDRLGELRPEDIQAEHLFMVDIAGLHGNEMEERLFDGRFDALWQHHSNMKWDLDIRTPWRSLFLGLSLLYAHAEVFFTGSQGAEINQYVFTFPLAFSETDRKGFHTVAQEVIRKIRQFCYGEQPDPQSDNFKYIETVDESTAIARSARVGAASTTMEVFVDVGGGTADIAIRHGSDFLVLDSLRVAGNTFFRFARKNFEQDLEGASEFKKHLARVLIKNPDNLNKELEFRNRSLDLSTFYSLAINSLSDETFKKREAKVIQEGMGKSSYQGYRTRLFFRHLLAYALLQACAAAVDSKSSPEDGIKLILGGNAWGLMLFAEMKRDSRKLKEEAQQILKLLKKQLADSVTEDERQYLEGLEVFGVELLNETNLSKAKTDVAVGALNADYDRRNDTDATLPYSGITVKNLRINKFEPTTISWRDRWGFEEFKRKLGFMDQITSTQFEQPRGLKTPLDPVLSVFTYLGNVSSNAEDNMPGETWRDINAELCENIARLKGNRLKASPINYFLSTILYPEDEQRDFLDTLAKENGSYKAERR
jgi:hypothetical protein